MDSIKKELIQLTAKVASLLGLKIKIFTAGILALTIAFLPIFSRADTTADSWTEITPGVHIDPATNDFIFVSDDTRKTSETYYRTIGFTVSDATMDGNGKIVESDLGKTDQGWLNISLDHDFVKFDNEIDLGGGKIATSYRLPYEKIIEKIAQQSPEWLSKINNPQGETYLKLDAILCVFNEHDYGKNPITGDLRPSAQMNPDGTWTGDAWDKHTIQELMTKYGWADPNSLLNHFDRGLMIALGIIDNDNNLLIPEEELKDMTLEELLEKKQEITQKRDSEFVTRIGKDAPEFWTYNYDPTGRFQIGDGIPTSEDITNGYTADRWYGNANIYQRGKGGEKAMHEWTFGGNITWTESYQALEKNKETGEDEWVTHEYSVSEPYTYVVTREVQYWYLGHTEIYDFTNATVTNEVYPGGSHVYDDSLDVPVVANANGTDLTSVTEYDYIPDDNYHVDWDRAFPSKDRVVNASGSSKAAAIEAFISISEERIDPNEEIWVRNDELEVDGNSYMNGSWYQYKEFESSGPGARSYNEMGEDDYGEESGEENGTIPSNTANDKYPTAIDVTYTQVVLGTHANKHFSKEGKAAILSGYEQNEPVVVHTPTVSSVIIADPETHERLDPNDPAIAEKYKTQLVTGATNGNADYQLLLDGTYTIKFISEVHFKELFDRGCFKNATDYAQSEYEEYYHYLEEKIAKGDFDFTHPGYKEMAETLYNKYCLYRQACFPFTVQINGKIYEPDNEWNVDGDVNKARKLPGYTEWIDLPVDSEFCIDFYIPSWATEGDKHVVMFRVAPENVVDHRGVDHLEQEDFEWLNNTTLNGVPLYEYVSTYSATVQLSGRIYDFQAVGINDRDTFQGLADDGKSWGYGLIQAYPFCPTKEEKRTGVLNRQGGTSVRYTVDGTLTNSWDPNNTLPFSIGRSQVFKDEGYLKKGNTFAFTVRTMANLWNEVEDPNGEDFLIITPTFRYYSEDGTEYRDVDVYCTKNSSDGKEELYFVPYGSEIDRSNFTEISIIDNRFDGSYYTDMGAYLNRTITQDDAKYSKDKCNEWMYNLKIAAVPTWPKEAYKTTNNYLSRETKCFCMSQIVLNSRLRLLTGNLEQLEMNLENQGGGLLHLDDKTESGAAYKVNEVTNPDYWDKHRMSMQTWFGAYWIPNQLYVTDGVFEADADGDGVKETYDTIWDYAEEKGYIEGNEDFIKKDGYLVINFDIKTVNDGQYHLQYYGGNKDQWQMEGCPDTVEVGDKAFNDTITIPVESGDVAIVDLEKSTMDNFYVGYNRIN